MVDYHGNTVAYGSGASWFARIVVNNAAVTTADSVYVEYAYDLYFSGSISDSTNSISWTDPWGAGNASNSNIQGAGWHRVSQVFGAYHPVQYGANTPMRFTMYASGFASGGTGPSTVDITHWLPPRVASPPNPPTIAIGNVTANSAFVWCTAAGAENGASAIDVNYRLHRNSDGALLVDTYGHGYGGFTFTGLERNTGYVAFARVRNAAGYGGWSGGVGFNTSATAPDQPAMPTATNVQKTSISYSWTAPADGGSPLQGWDVDVATDVGFGNKVFSRSFAANITSWVVPDLQVSTTYYMRVRTWNNSNGGNAYSATSPILVTTTLADVPLAPGALTISNITGNAAVLRWGAAPTRGVPVTTYRVEVATVSDFATTVFVDNAVAPSAALNGYTMTGLAGNTEYYVRVRANSTLGPGAWSQTALFRTVAGFTVNVGGSPKIGQIWLRLPGFWHRGQLWLKVGSTWKQITFDPMLKIAVPDVTYPATYLPTY